MDELGDDLKRFDAFRALPDAEKRDLFDRAVSAAFYNQAANQHRAMPIGERLVELLDIDFARAVRPTENYFWKRLTRARMLEIAEAVVGTEWAKARRKHKKGRLAADMAAVFGDDPQGRAALDAEARERVEQWCSLLATLQMLEVRKTEVYARWLDGLRDVRALSLIHI